MARCLTRASFAPVPRGQSGSYGERPRSAARGEQREPVVRWSVKFDAPLDLRDLMIGLVYDLIRPR